MANCRPPIFDCRLPTEGDQCLSIHPTPLHNLALICYLCAAQVLCSVAPATAEPSRSEKLLDVLVKAYPDFLDRREGNEVMWKDGTRMPFDDGKGSKDFDTLLERPDLEDMFYAPYPLGRTGTPPGVNMDPGRVRFLPFLNKM